MQSLSSAIVMESKGHMDEMITYPQYRQIRKGGEGSGNFGHSGRVGQVGGSMPGTLTKLDLVVLAKNIPGLKEILPYATEKYPHIRNGMTMVSALTLAFAGDSIKKYPITGYELAKDIDTHIQKDIESRIVKLPHEEGYIIDRYGTVIQQSKGLGQSVSFSRPIPAGSIITHNHPGHDSLSPEDAQLAIRNNVRQIRAVSDKYLYTLSSPNNGWLDRSGKFLSQLEDVWYAQLSDIEKRIRSINFGSIASMAKKMTQNDYEGLASHASWLRASVMLALPYRRRILLGVK